MLSGATLMYRSVLAALLLSATPHGGEEKWAFSEDDGKVIMQGDFLEASRAIGDLWRPLQHQGKETVRDAVPALVYKFRQLENLKHEEGAHFGEGHGEMLLEIIGLLSKIGDPRSKDVLIEGMKYGKGAAKGLLAIGPSVIPDLANALGSSRDEIRRASLLAFIALYELDSSFFDQHNRELVRRNVVTLLADKEPFVRRRAIGTLGYFGDEMTVAILDSVAAHDPFTVKRKGKPVHLNRIAAREAIDKIRARLN